MNIVMIDNYDSFTYNLVHYVEGILDKDITVIRNDQLNLDDLEVFDKIILSPGPGLPSEAGKLNDIIKKYAEKKPVLGVCLGQQAIGEVFGGKLKNLNKVYHGVATKMKVVDKEEALFKNIPETFLAGRYHSWVIDKNTLPKEFKVTAVDEEGEIMAISHSTKPIKGVQFHPESILTEHGKKIIENFIRL
ncbi:MAG: aminodeoxychorismate/anthranilate synthase component II [Vicingaceae bacterium]